MNVDTLVQDLGGCGCFQVSLVISTTFTSFAAVWGMMMMAFGNYNPGWTCADNILSVNDSDLGSSTIFTPHNTVYRDEMLDANSDIIDIINSTAMSVTGSPVDTLLVVNSTRNFSAVDVCETLKSCRHVIFHSESSTIVSEWKLVCDKSWVPSVIIIIQMAGVLLGSYVTGQLGDRLGRRISLYGNVAFHALANLLAVFSVSWQMFAILRFFVGFGVGGILACSFVYSIEFITNWWRGMLGALPVWNVGAATFSVAVLLLRDWRHVHVATCVLSVLAFLPVVWVPESMRWLAVQSNDKGANKVLRKIAYMNKRPVPSAEILEAIAQEERERSKITQENKPTYLDLFKETSVRKATIIMGIVWICLSIIYYAISFGVRTFSGDFFINFLIFSVAEIPGMLFVAPAANILGRRWGSVVHMFVSAVVCLATVPVIFLVQDEGVKGRVITGLALAAKLAIVGAWQVVGVFSTELCPTVVRNLSLGFLNAASRIGSMIAPYIIPDDSASLYLSFLFMGLLMLVCCGLLIALPETKGRPLEDTMKARTPIVKLSPRGCELNNNHDISSNRENFID